ncbi:MAG TPA: hypothetical protein VN253_11465 [Kofleriaceae bacterium]|nr:hypothetical protein [Kofleriaceae bacterium]
MRWIVLVPAALAVALGACGGPKVPMHSGYKSDKAKPWKKPKQLVFDDKLEAKTDGDLSYRDYKRARWYEVDLPANGELTLKLEVTPPGDAVNDDFDLALEVLDPGFRVISKSDREESDAGELAKTKTLYDLAAGKYLIHIYLQGRMDTAEFNLRAAFKRTAPAEVKTSFPSDVEFVTPLAMVPPKDDTPVTYKPPKVVVTTTVKRPPPTPKKEDPKPAEVLTARITAINVVNNKTQITIGRGTATDARDGMKGQLKGVGTFSLEGCTEKRCKATLSATPDQVRSAGENVVLMP